MKEDKSFIHLLGFGLIILALFYRCASYNPSKICGDQCENNGRHYSGYKRVWVWVECYCGNAKDKQESIGTVP